MISDFARDLVRGEFDYRDLYNIAGCIPTIRNVNVNAREANK